MMNTEDLNRFMMRDPFIRRFYGGVVASNNLPVSKSNEPKLYIVNTEDSSKPGQHWISIFVTNIPEYYDPLGSNPLDEFKHFLICNGPSYYVNKKVIQGKTSTLCGLFALHYAYFRCRQYSMQQILDMFTTNTVFNDLLVSYFYELTT